MAVFIYGVSSERMLLFLPLFAPLAAAGNVQEELKSRYAVFLVSRAGKKNYLAGKILGTALSGGLMTVTAFAAALAVIILAAAATVVVVKQKKKKRKAEEEEELMDEVERFTEDERE